MIRERRQRRRSGGLTLYGTSLPFLLYEGSRIILTHFSLVSHFYTP